MSAAKAIRPDDARQRAIRRDRMRRMYASVDPRLTGWLVSDRAAAREDLTALEIPLEAEPPSFEDFLRNEGLYREQFEADGRGASASPRREYYAMTLEAVGHEFGLDRERIRQIEAKALRKLRHPKRSGLLREFYVEDDDLERERRELAEYETRLHDRAVFALAESGHIIFTEHGANEWIEKWKERERKRE